MRRTPRSGSSAGFPPLPIAAVALTGIRNRFCPIRSVSRLVQQAAQVNGQLPIDVFASRGRECFRLGSQCHDELAVVLMGDGAKILEHREDLAPLDVPAGGVVEDLLDRLAMVTAHVRGHGLVLSCGPTRSFGLRRRGSQVEDAIGE